MGLSYAFQLVFPRKRAADVLRATAAFAEPVGERRITLPGGEQLTLPFTTRLESGETTVEPGVWMTFDTSLWLPVDDAEAWQDYLREGVDGRVREANGGREASVGYVYLTVGIEERYALLTFSAATSGMSRLFYESKAVWKRFARLLEENGGLRGLLDLEWGSHFPLITEPGAYVTLDESVLRETAARVAVSRKGRNRQPSSATAFSWL